MKPELKRGEKTRKRILEAGLNLWIEQNGNVNAHQIAVVMDVTHSAILYHYKTVENLRNSIAEYAVKVGNSRVIMHLVALRHPSVYKLDADARARHVRIAQA